MTLRRLAASLVLGALAALVGSGCAFGVSPRRGPGAMPPTAVYSEPGYEQAYYDSPGYAYAYAQPAPVYVAPTYGYYGDSSPRTRVVYAPARARVRGPVVVVRAR